MPEAQRRPEISSPTCKQYDANEPKRQPHVNSCPTPTPKTSLWSSPPSGCSRSLAGPWPGHLPMPALSASRVTPGCPGARRGVRWCWGVRCARRNRRCRTLIPRPSPTGRRVADRPGWGCNAYGRPRPSPSPFQELARFHPAVNWRFSVKNRVKRPDMEADTKSDRHLALFVQLAYDQA